MNARTRTLRTCLALLVVAACAALAAGCGGGTSKSDYEAQMAAVVADLGKASQAVSTMKADAPAAQRAATIRQQGVLLGKAADKADAIDPPSNAKAAHDDFVSALHAYAKLLGRLADASKSDKTTAQQAEILGEAAPLIDKMTKASNRLEKAGYHFKPSSAKK